MIRVTLKLFGPLRDILGRDDMPLVLAPPYDGTNAFETIAAESPELLAWRSSVRLAVNLEYVPMSHVLREGDEICFIPPVSGG